MILDYYNFYDELEKINEEGKIDQSVVPSAPRTNQTSDEVLSMYYRKDSDAGSGREAAATYPSKFSPSLVMIGKENITSFTMLVTTIAHELVHVKQHTKGATVPGGATELFPEMMEIRGTFGNITLPGRTVGVVSQDYYRGSYEYLKLKEMSDSKKYRKDRNELYTLYKKQYATGLTEAQNTIDKYKKEKADAQANISKSVYSTESPVSLTNYGNAMAVIQRHNMAETTLPLLDAAYDFVDQPYDIVRLNTLQAKFVPFSAAEWANYGDYPDTKLPEVKGTVNKDYDMIRAQLFFPLQWTDAKVSMEKTNIAAQKTKMEGELTTLETDRRKLEVDPVTNAKKIADIDVLITAKKDSIKALQDQIDKINTQYDAFKKAVDYVGIVQLHDRLK
ncbi:MAG: hypothetical protein FD123_2849 [Bacteroidetes bacterium]|nr:MAG: hypothetical protein FD123_2849 [Bacteroidota bacterium]